MRRKSQAEMERLYGDPAAAGAAAAREDYAIFKAERKKALDRIDQESAGVYEDMDTDCPVCGWGAIGCANEPTGCANLKS